MNHCIDQVTALDANTFFYMMLNEPFQQWSQAPLICSSSCNFYISFSCIWFS